MTLLTICTELALDVGMSVPDSVAASTSREWTEAKSFSEQVADELARRVDWGELSGQATLTGDGTNQTFTLPTGFSRLAMGAAVTTGVSPLYPLSRAEWGTLTAAEGTPRYFLLEGDQITLWPYLANAETVTVNYQTGNWCSNGTGAWTADDDTALIDEDIIAKGLIVRWRRQKGMDYADYEAEFEAAVLDLAGFNDGARS